MLKNLQYGFGFLIGFLGALILCIGAIMGVESLIGRPMPLKVPLTILISIGAGVVVSRWIGRLDLSRFVAAPAKAAPEPAPAPEEPAKPAHAAPRRRKPWSFDLVGTLITFWAISLAGIIVLFGPFGFSDDPSLGIRLLKMVVLTVAIAGLGVVLLRKELAKLMSTPPPPKK